MKITNKFGYPPPIYKALCGSDYDKHGDFSVTELINPPRLSVLRIRHDAEIEIDASQNAYAIESSSMHALLSEVHLPGALAEERFIVTILGRQVSMKPDYAYRDTDGSYVLLDNKRTSWKATREGPKDEHVKQLNCYAYGLRQRGFNVKRLIIVAWYRDWSWMECHVKKLAGYPPSEIGILDVPMWPDDRCLAFLESRVRLHMETRQLNDENLPECTGDERWAKPDTFAVVFTEGKSKGRACNGGAAFDSLVEAQSFLGRRKEKDPSDTATVVHRPGVSTRCNRYCPVAKFCSQYAKTQNVDPF